MRRALLVAGKDLRTLAVSPIPWVAAAVFHGAAGLLFVDQLAARGQAVTQPLVPLAGFLLLAVAALITMRSIAEERRAGTLDLLEVQGLRPGPLVLGKWLAATLTCWAILLPLGLAVALVAGWGDPDPGVAIAGAVGLALLAAAACAVGVLASSLTTSQPVAATLAFFALTLSWFSARTPGARGGPLARASLSERTRAAAGGALDLGDVGALVLLTAVALGGAVVALAARRRRRLGLVAVPVLLAALLVGGVALEEVRGQVDLTTDRSLTLSEPTHEVVRALTGPAEVTALLSASEGGRAEAGALLQRYERLSSRITTRLVDPQDAAGELRRLGVEPALDRLVVRRGDRVERATTVSEQDVTAALARLERGRTATVCLATGHGEVAAGDTTPEGMSTFAALLERNGLTVVGVDLLVDPAVPPSCRAVVLANPTTALGPAEATLAAYLDGGGRALVLADPASTIDLRPLLEPYGLGLARGIVAEGDEESRLPGDPVTLVARDFPTTHPVVRRMAPLVLPTAQGVAVAATDAGVVRPGLSATALVRSTRLAYLETEPVQFRFDASADVAGPIDLAAAADRSENRGSTVARTRVVVVGDVDLVTNGVIEQGDDGRFLLQAVDWLTGEDDLVVVNANLARVRPLVLSPARLRYARLLLSGLLPALALLLGAIVWAHRRGR